MRAKSCAGPLVLARKRAPLQPSVQSALRLAVRVPAVHGCPLPPGALGSPRSASRRRSPRCSSLCKPAAQVALQRRPRRSFSQLPPSANCGLSLGANSSPTLRSRPTAQTSCPRESLSATRSREAERRRSVSARRNDLLRPRSRNVRDTSSSVAGHARPVIADSSPSETKTPR